MTDWGFLVDEAYEAVKESKNNEEK